eukprot:scaffold23456_cov49-Phaeocystis_antarctica.AAC.2
MSATMETRSDPELGTETSLGRQGTVKVKTSVQWQASSGLSRTWLHPGPHPHPHYWAGPERGHQEEEVGRV